jgi:sarcosine oxidase subunit beta
MAPHVCVVGGGAIGLCAALELSGMGARVTVLERGDLAGESSGLSVGIIETQYLRPFEIDLRAWGMRSFDRLEAEHGLEVTRNGYLRLARAPEQLDAFAASVEHQRSLGIEARVLSPDEIAARVPEYDLSGVLGGLWGPNDGFIDGHSYCMLLADMARERGVTIRTGTEVTGGRRISRAHVLSTSRGELECDVVVNAAGARADRIGELLGAPVFVHPQRHQAVIAHLSRVLGHLMPSVMDYTPHSGEVGLYLRHEGPGRLVVGLHTGEPLHERSDPDSYGRSADQEFLEQVAERFAQRLPSLDDARLAHGWAGLYPISPDGLPQVGRHPDAPAVVSAAAAGGSGIMLSPVIGRLAAEWAILGRPEVVSEDVARRLAPERRSVRSPVGASN